MNRAIVLAALSLILAVSQPVKADQLSGQPAKAEQSFRFAPPESLVLAQSEADDAYDPFADYSEFEESSEEEEDINFFRNGRLFTMGFLLGYRGWTGNLGNIYSGDPNFGLYMSYFFDLRFALQFGFLTGSHSIRAKAPTSELLLGNLAMTDLSFNLKYYFNTQNVTRGLADLNPYVLAGFSQLLRTQSYETQADEVFKDSAFGFNVGAGIEIPMMRNKMYFGLQGSYQLANFADENKFLRDENDVQVVKPAGDSWNAVGIIGINF